MSQSGERELFDARDAYSSAILLALLVLSGQLIFFATFDTASRGVPLWVHVAQAMMSAAALAYLVATHKRPLEGAALGACGLLVVPYFVLVPWAAVRWAHLGRPWEAFAVPQIAMISLGLTVPRSPRLAIAAVLAFLIQSIGIYVYFLWSGLPRAWLPVTEPANCIGYAALGILVVLLRRQRRELTLRHIRAEAEVTTLERLSSVLGSAADRLGEPLAVLSEGLDRLVALDIPALKRTRAAVAKLKSVAGELRAHAVGAPAPARPPAPVEPLTPRKTRLRLRASAPVIEPPRPADAGDRGLTESERSFYAEDAQRSARAFALASLAVAPFFIAAAGHRSRALQLTSVVPLVVTPLAILWILHRTRRQPSERRGNILYIVGVVVFLLWQPYWQQQWASGSAVFEPLLGTKYMVIVIAMVAPRYRWIGLTMIFLAVAEGMALFHFNHFEALRDHRIPKAEPWPMLLHVLVALALLFMREQRRVASLELLRTDREATALRREASLLLALLDQIGTPLQVVASSIALVRAQHPDRPELFDMEQAVHTIVALRDDLPKVAPWAYGYVGDSFDGASNLRRR